MKDYQISIPDWWMNIPYNGKIIPNGEEYNIAVTGANCQVFAYFLLRTSGLFVPEYRSSELWEDVEYSEVIHTDFAPLDLLFFHKKETSYGAHIAVYLGNGQAIHLSKRINRPVIWAIETFAEYPEYPFLLGAKRFFNNKR